jgi:hypothetical protein
MKRTTTAALVTLFCAVSAMADESWVLDIPLHFDAQQETGEVRIAMTLSAAPAGSQLLINGNTTFNLGDTKPVGGDSATFDAGPGNSIMITYRPLSNFGADFCTGGAAVQKDIPMRFIGAQDIVDYRMSSYNVASPTVECSQPSRRTADSPANIVLTGDGVAPALVATNLFRLPIDVVLVLDKSGSMTELPPGAAVPPTKVEILHSAIETFIGDWQQIDAPTPQGTDFSNDRMGVVFFDSTAVAQTIPTADPPVNFFARRAVGGSSPWDDVIAQVQTLTPGSSTSIGGGVNEAMKQWKADPQHDVYLVVVTDGKQNTAPLITTLPSTFLGLDPVSGLPQELRKRFIPIQVLGFGTPAAVDENLLTYLSFETSGRSFISVNATTVFDDLASTLVSILKGNTASLVMRNHATMSGAGPGPLLTLPVDRSARRVMFSLQWAPPLVNALDLEVFPPGTAPGGAPAAPTSSKKPHQASIQTFDIDPNGIGTWSVRVKRAPSFTGAPNADVPYTLNVFFLEGSLDYRISSETVHAATGDTIALRAKVTYDGKPLTHLPPDAIRVRIQRPPEALGTILHDARFNDPSSGNTTTPSGDVQTPYDRKLASLDAGLIDRVMPRDLNTISLVEASNGVYTGSFDQTSTPGLYGFETVLDWDDKRTGHVHREERLEEHVKVKPDAVRTDIRTARVDRNTVAISVTPRDKFGNYLGPGYASLVKAKLNSSGTIMNALPIDRDESGTYVFTIGNVPPGETPDVDITVDGIAAGNASSHGVSSSSVLRGFIDAGPNFPHGKWSVNAGVERLMSNDWSIEAIAGRHLFDGSHVWQWSGGVKRYFSASPFRPFVNASIGVYSGQTTKAGGSIGAGLLYEVSPTFGVEGVWNHHHADSNFSTVQLGVRFRL